MAMSMANVDSTDQALTGVAKVGDNDIICGRGGLALKHPGNMAYRKIVGLNKELYATCLKTEKLRISKSIVAAIREIKGRFLEREDGKTSSSLDEKDEEGNPVLWRDIGNKRAIEKTSQALREGQPKLLKKLAQQQETNGAIAQAAVGVNPMVMSGNFNQNLGVSPHSQMVHPLGNLESIPQQRVPDNFNQYQAGIQAYGQLPSLPNSLETQHRRSYTLTEMVQGRKYGDFGQNSVDENDPRGLSVNSESNRHESWQDSWGPENPAPLGLVKNVERCNSRNSQDSWGMGDPTPLPYTDVEGGGRVEAKGDVFSSDNQQQLMTCLGVHADELPQDVAPPAAVCKVDNSKRASVKFHLDPHRPSMSGMSLASHLSELSIFSADALSLDSAMDAAQRDAEFEMLGEFDMQHNEGMSIGTFEDGSGSSPPPGSTRPRRSILRKSAKWAPGGVSFLPAPLHNSADPGLIFTSTLDAKPGGVNAGTDVSGLIGERRKSVVAFEVDVNRRRSSRMSMCSALTEFSERFKREIGSMYSIQSTEFREMMEDLASDDDDDEGEDS